MVHYEPDTLKFVKLIILWILIKLFKKFNSSVREPIDYETKPIMN